MTPTGISAQFNNFPGRNADQNRVLRDVRLWTQRRSRSETVGVERGFGMSDLRRCSIVGDPSLRGLVAAAVGCSDLEDVEDRQRRGWALIRLLCRSGERPLRTALGVRRNARHRHAVVVLAVLALSSLLLACGDDTRMASDGGGGPTPQPTASQPVASDGWAGEPTDEPLPSGEIWQWALGRSIWDDQALAELASTMGPSSDSIMMQPYGFQLDVDTSGRVAAVRLFNDEVALGLPASDSSFSAYQGALPTGLSWDDTYDTIVSRHGEGVLITGGWGVSYSFAYQTDDGYELDLTYLANHEDELPGSPLHVVTLIAVPG